MPELQVRERIAALIPEASYTLINGPSTAFSSRNLREKFGNRDARFISVDGSHECADVVWDLRLAEDLLSSEGIVAVDDFMNPIAIGVNEGVHRFYGTTRSIVPFAFLANKLLLCRPHMADEYKKTIEDFAVNDQTEPYSKFIRDHRENNRQAIEQFIWGWKIITFG